MKLAFLVLIFFSATLQAREPRTAVITTEFSKSNMIHTFNRVKEMLSSTYYSTGARFSSIKTVECYRQVGNTKLTARDDISEPIVMGKPIQPTCTFKRLIHAPDIRAFTEHEVKIDSDWVETSVTISIDQLADIVGFLNGISENPSHDIDGVNCTEGGCTIYATIPIEPPY